MKKKRLSLLLVATMVFSLCACGSPDGNGNSGAQISVEQSDPIESTDSNEEDEPSDEELKPDYDVEEQVLLDTGGHHHHRNRAVSQRILRLSGTQSHRFQPD